MAVSVSRLNQKSKLISYVFESQFCEGLVVFGCCCFLLFFFLFVFFLFFFFVSFHFAVKFSFFALSV